MSFRKAYRGIVTECIVSLWDQNNLGEAPISLIGLNLLVYIVSASNFQEGQLEPPDGKAEDIFWFQFFIAI